MKNHLKITLVVFVMTTMVAFAQKPAKKNPPTPASTQEPNRPPQDGNGPPNGRRPQFSELLSRMDANKDGKLSLAEVQGPLKNDFAKVDTNKDGFITEAELKNAPPPPPPPHRN